MGGRETGDTQCPVTSELAAADRPAVWGAPTATLLPLSGNVAVITSGGLFKS